MGAPWLPSDPPMVTMCPHGRTAKGGLGIQRHGKTPYTNKGVTVDSILDGIHPEDVLAMLQDWKSAP
jgi:hypothetical protein